MISIVFGNFGAGFDFTFTLLNKFSHIQRHELGQFRFLLSHIAGQFTKYFNTGIGLLSPFRFQDFFCCIEGILNILIAMGWVVFQFLISKWINRLISHNFPFFNYKFCLFYTSIALSDNKRNLFESFNLSLIFLWRVPAYRLVQNITEKGEKLYRVVENIVV